MTIFIYEYVTASGEHHDTQSWCSPSLLVEGRAMRDAIVEDFRQVPGVQVITLTEADSQEKFKSCASRCDDSLIIAPEFAGILETRCRWVLEAGGRLLGPAPEAVRLTADKLALFYHFQKHGIATPRTWAFPQAPGKYPQVWKPRDGAGSQMTFRIRNAEELDTSLRMIRQEGQEVDELIVQPLLKGIPASVSFLIGPQGRMALPPSYQRLSEDGRFQYLGGSCPIEPNLVERAIKIADEALRTIPGLLGYVGVDLILGENESEDYVIEVNPRLTTSYVGLRQLAAFNIAEAMLRLAHGDPLPPLSWKKEQIGFQPDGTLSPTRHF